MKVLEAFDDKTVLVTGGAGSIGYNLVKTLCNLKTKKIIVIDDLSSSCEWNLPSSPKVVFIKGNILDDEKLKLSFKRALHQNILDSVFISVSSQFVQILFELI